MFLCSWMQQSATVRASVATAYLIKMGQLAVVAVTVTSATHIERILACVWTITMVSVNNTMEMIPQWW